MRKLSNRSIPTRCVTHSYVPYRIYTCVSLRKTSNWLGDNHGDRVNARFPSRRGSVPEAAPVAGANRKEDQRHPPLDARGVLRGRWGRDHAQINRLEWRHQDQHARAHPGRAQVPPGEVENAHRYEAIRWTRVLLWKLAKLQLILRQCCDIGVVFAYSNLFT